jgi:hypothetical protein
VTLRLRPIVRLGFILCLALAVSPIAPLVADVPFDPGLFDSKAGAQNRQVQCIADCGSYAIGCWSSEPCLAQDRDCSVPTRGFALCLEQTVVCNEPCDCVNGSTRLRSSRDCCCNYDDEDNPERLTRVYQDVCVDGAWVPQSSTCTGDSCPGGGECEV